MLAELHAPGALRVTARAREGEAVRAGAVLAEIEGELAPLLTGERVLLNLVQALCGVATLTRRFVDAVAGTGVAIVDTRKTTPGLRLLQKYAVRMGGGRNHRFGLDDGVLVKDNHVAACGSLRAAVERARAAAPMGAAGRGRGRPARADRRRARRRRRPDPARQHATGRGARGARRWSATRALLEVSGGVTLETVRALAESGPDLISIGRLTHSAPAIDLGLDLRARAASGSRPRVRAARRTAVR